MIDFVISTYLLPSLQPQNKVDKLRKYCLEDKYCLESTENKIILLGNNLTLQTFQALLRQSYPIAQVTMSMNNNSRKAQCRRVCYEPIVLQSLLCAEVSNADRRRNKLSSQKTREIKISALAWNFDGFNQLVAVIG